MTTKQWLTLITTFVFFSMTPYTILFLHKLKEIILLKNIGYDSVIGSSAVFLYMIIAVILLIYLPLTYYVDTHKNNKSFIKNMFFITIISVAIGTLNYAYNGLAI